MGTKIKAIMFVGLSVLVWTIWFLMEFSMLVSIPFSLLWVFLWLMFSVIIFLFLPEKKAVLLTSSVLAISIFYIFSIENTGEHEGNTVKLDSKMIAEYIDCNNQHKADCTQKMTASDGTPVVLTISLPPAVMKEMTNGN